VEEQNSRRASCGPLLFEIISNTAEPHIYGYIFSERFTYRLDTFPTWGFPVHSSYGWPAKDGAAS
jgi:hypothetical protein